MLGPSQAACMRAFPGLRSQSPRFHGQDLLAPWQARRQDAGGGAHRPCGTAALRRAGASSQLRRQPLRGPPLQDQGCESRRFYSRSAPGDFRIAGPQGLRAGTPEVCSTSATAATRSSVPTGSCLCSLSWLSLPGTLCAHKMGRTTPQDGQPWPPGHLAQDLTPWGLACPPTWPSSSPRPRGLQAPSSKPPSS